MVPGAVLLEEADQLINTVQRRVEVGARLTPMACTQTHLGLKQMKAVNERKNNEQESYCGS